MKYVVVCGIYIAIYFKLITSLFLIKVLLLLNSESGIATRAETCVTGNRTRELSPTGRGLNGLSQCFACYPDRSGPRHISYLFFCQLRHVQV